MNARIARGALNYPGIGSTEHGQAPEGFPCLVSRTYLGDGQALYRRVADGVLAWELQKRSGLRVRTDVGHSRARRARGERIRRRPLPDQGPL